MLEDVAANAFAFAAEDQRDFSAEIDGGWCFAAVRRSVDPILAFLERLDRAREVRHLRDRHPLRRARRRLHDRNVVNALRMRSDRFETWIHAVDDHDARASLEGSDGPS